MQINLTDDELIEILILLEKDSQRALKKKIENQIYNKPVSRKKRGATAKATQIKIDKSRRAIKDTLERLKAKGKPITIYQVAKESGVSYNTAKKYKYLFQDDLTK